MYAPHMQSGVSSIHNVSQNKLNGSPSTMGLMRSHRETEKHMAANGMSARSSAPKVGGFTVGGTSLEGGGIQ
jgi:hypothetical protein